MLTSAPPAVPVEITDPVNARILAVSEDRIAGFLTDPFAEIAARSGVPVETVLERLRAMLAAGTIRRIRQTLMATNLAPGALVAWLVAPERLDAAFDLLVRDDPFSGHVVIRSTDSETQARCTGSGRRSRSRWASTWLTTATTSCDGWAASGIA